MTAAFFYKWRNVIHKISNLWMGISIFFIILLPLSIGLGLVLKSLPIMEDYSFSSLILSSEWSPSEGKFGFLIFIISSLCLTILSFIIAAPICVFSSIYLTQFAPNWLLKVMHLVIDVLAGIPSVVYGVWGIIVIVPFISNVVSPFINYSASGYCLLAGSIVLAIMSIPYILNMLIEVVRSMPIELKEASLSLGATEWETIKKVLLRQGSSGIIAALGLGISKALGETIAVLMVVGNMVKMPHHLLDPAYPIPALIVNNYGDMMSIPMYDTALMFSGLILFIIILLFNILSNLIIYRGKKKYE